MFCDLVGSAALSGKFDPEDLWGVIAAYHRCCSEMVERNGCQLARPIWPRLDALCRACEARK